jgi:hypothetical protein
MTQIFTDTDHPQADVKKIKFTNISVIIRAICSKKTGKHLQWFPQYNPRIAYETNLSSILVCICSK